jgi:hypothetical protein
MIYINTVRFFEDFKIKYYNLKVEIMNDRRKIDEYGRRLDWAIEEPDAYMFDQQVTPPGKIKFIVQKNN